MGSFVRERETDPTPTGGVMVLPRYKYSIRGERQLSDTADPPQETIEATSELNAADIYFHRHGRRRLVRMRRVG